jgi:PQQ-like domain
MPADLDRLFSAMGAHADGAAVLAPESVRRRGDQRRRSRIAATCVTVALLVGAVAAIARTDVGRHDTPPAQPTPRATVAFTPLRQAGGTISIPLGTTGVGMAAVSGNRVFVVGITSQHHVLLGASDLNTGRPIWPTADTGQIGDWPVLYLSPEAVVVAAGRAASPHLGVVMVFDPTTGAKRFQVDPTTAGGAAFDSVLVVTSAAEHAVRGIDWITGAERWRIAIAAGDQPIVTQNLATPKENGLGVGQWPDAANERLYVISTDGTVRTYNGNTGALLGTRPEAIPRRAGGGTPTYVAYGDVLYTIIGGTEVRAVDLAATTAAADEYTAPVGSTVRSLAPCGPGRFCVIEDNNGNVQLAAVDLATYTVLWRRPAPQATYLGAVGDRILTDRGQLYDLSGQLLSDTGAFDAFWLTPGSALILSRADYTDINSDTAVSGLSTVDGTTTLLGRIPPVTGACTQTMYVLVCPAADGFHLWHFAAG